MMSELKRYDPECTVLELDARAAVLLYYHSAREQLLSCFIESGYRQRLFGPLGTNYVSKGH